MSLKLACPRCRHVQFCDDARAGEPAVCAKCAQAFRVPRQEGPAPDDTSIDSVAWPSTGHLQARELPTSFAPPEIAAVKVVEMPVEVPRRSGYAEIDESSATATPRRRAPRSANPRVRLERDEPSRRPWTIGISLIAFFLLMFVATAAWFLLRDERRPQDPVAFQPQMNPRPGQPQFQPQFQQQFPPQPFIPGVQQQKGRGWPNLQKGQMVDVAPQGNERVTAIKLVKGEAKVRGKIDFNDPSDPLSPGCLRKVYVVELDAKRNYTIEMNADPPQPGGGLRVRRGQALPFFDPFLRLEDERGKIMDWNDDIIEGVNLDARVRLQNAAKGKYRIIATTFGENETGDFFLTIRDDNLGIAVGAQPLSDRPLPEPIRVNDKLPSAKSATRNLTITTVCQNDAPLMGDLCWSKDGKAVFLLDDNGSVKRIAWQTSVEEIRLETGLEVESLCVSRAGLLVSLPTMEEVWVLDPETLHVKQRISVPGVRRVTATPASDIAFAAVKATQPPLPAAPNGLPNPKGLPFQPGGGFMPKRPAAPTELQPLEWIMVLDAAKATAVRKYNYSPKNLTVTPDGKYLFAEGGIEALTQYRIDGSELTRDQISPRLAGNGQGIFISPDSKFVCLPSPGGNYAINPNENLPLYTTLIFKTDDLSKPVVAVQTGESPRTIGFDSKAGWIFGHNNQSQFMRFSQTGVKSLEEVLPGDDRLAKTPRQFLPHPDGIGVLIRTQRDVYAITWNK